MKETAPYYGLQAWKKLRNQYVKKVGGLCEICKAQGIIKAGEFVHHRKFIDPSNVTDPAVFLNEENLMLVCRYHHDQLHNKNPKRYKLDDLGRVIFNQD